MNYSILSLLSIKPEELKAEVSIVPAVPVVSIPFNRTKKYVVVDYGNGKTYFFIGSMYYRYDNAADKVDPGYPLPISAGWKGIWPDGIDACLSPDSNTLYFYRDSEYIRFDLPTDCADPGYPRQFQGHLPGCPWSSIDAAFNLGNGKGYIFKGSQYYRFDFKRGDTDPGYPMTIHDGWRGVWSEGIDSAFKWGRLPNKLYFFSGTYYTRFDVVKDEADDGYPIRISQGWQGIPDIA